MSRPLSILVVRLSAHGDVIQTLPLLAELKALYPDCRIGWVVEASAAPLLQGHPLIDALHVVYRKQWLQALKKPWLWPQTLQAIGQFIQDLKMARYSLSVDVQGLLKSAVWPVLAGIPKRLGFANTREYADWCYTHPLPAYPMSDTSDSTIDRFRAMAHYITPNDPTPFTVPLKPLAFPLVPVQADALALITQWLESTLATNPIVALAPHTLWPSKHWPSAYWEALLDQLMTLPITIVLLGSPADATALTQLEASAHARASQPKAVVLNWGGKTDWPQLHAFMAHRLAVLIGPDSAPLHLASAIAYDKAVQGSSKHSLKPYVVGLFGPTSVNRTGPLSPPNAVVPHVVLHTALACQPCLKRRCPLPPTITPSDEVMACMTQLTPTMVYDQVMKALAFAPLSSA
jgi:heptosyltransferase I